MASWWLPTKDGFFCYRSTRMPTHGFTSGRKKSINLVQYFWIFCCRPIRALIPLMLLICTWQLLLSQMKTHLFLKALLCCVTFQLLAECGTINWMNWLICHPIATQLIGSIILLSWKSILIFIGCHQLSWLQASKSQTLHCIPVQYSGLLKEVAKTIWPWFLISPSLELLSSG